VEEGQPYLDRNGRGKRGSNIKGSRKIVPTRKKIGKKKLALRPYVSNSGKTIFTEKTIRVPITKKHGGDVLHQGKKKGR